jgi:predicted transcriptional regulator
MKWATNEALTSQPCWTSINKGFRNEPHAFRRDAKLQEVINFMQTQSMRRVAIVGDDGALLSVVTQSYLLRYLASHLKDIGNLGSMTVAQLQLGFRDVRSFAEDSTALDAFMAMWREGLSGAAVVDKHGKILGNLSIDDVKDIDHDAASFEKMFESCGAYIRHKLYGASVAKLISVDSSAHVRDVIQKFVDTSVHRLYVIDHDAHHRPVTRGVISIRDVLHLVVHFGAAHHGA